MATDINSITNIWEMRNLLRQNQFQTRVLTKLEFTHIAKLCGAVWLHSGNPKTPHAELTSGKCSNGFVDVLRLLRLSNVCDIMGQQLAQVYRQWCLRNDKSDSVDWVIGSDHAGATLSFAAALALNTQHDFTEKGPDKTQVWKRFQIEPNEEVLQVEELVTTTGTLQAVRDGIRKGTNGLVKFAPAVMTLVHRSSTYELEGSPILYLVHYDIEVWEPSECPLCAAGSKRLRPKQNWAELTGKAV